MISISYIIYILFFGCLATFCAIVESSYLKKYKKSEDSYEKYESYRKSLNYNFLKIFWYICCLFFLICFIVSEFLIN